LLDSLLQERSQGKYRYLKQNRDIFIFTVTKINTDCMYKEILHKTEQ